MIGIPNYLNAIIVAILTISAWPLWKISKERSALMIMFFKVHLN